MAKVVKTDSGIGTSAKQRMDQNNRQYEKTRKIEKRRIDDVSGNDYASKMQSDFNRRRDKTRQRLWDALNKSK